MNENTLDFLMSLAKTDIQKEIIELVSTMDAKGLTEEDILKALLSSMSGTGQ